MKYMLLIYGDENELSETERGLFRRVHGACTSTALEWTVRGGQSVTSHSYATSVRVREGKRLVTDDPFAETREQPGRCFLIDAKNLNEAVSVATLVPGVRIGTIEVRPLIEITGLPNESRLQLMER